MLMSELLPTFDLPINANSFFVGAGHSSNVVEDFTKSALVIFIFLSIRAKLGHLLGSKTEWLLTMLYTLKIHSFPLLPTTTNKA